MNKIFDFNRFGKVFVHDFHTAYAQFGTGILILMLVPQARWLFELTMGFSLWSDCVSVSAESRYVFISLATAWATVLAPSRIYKNANLAGKGNYFAMLPASLPEKYISMLIYSFVLVPLTVFVGAIVGDVVLTLLPFGPYKQFIWHGWSVWPMGMGSFTAVNTEFSVEAWIIMFLSSLLPTSIFLFTNTLFKKNKVTKTILWGALICFVLMIIGVPVITNYASAWPDIFYSYESWEHILFWITLILQLLANFLLLFFTYRRLKRMQY